VAAKFVPQNLATPALNAARRALEASYLDGFGVTAPLEVNARVGKWVSVTTADGLALSLGLNQRDVFVTTEDAPTAAVNPTGPVDSATPVYPTKLALRNTFGLVRILPTNSSAWLGTMTPLTGVFGGSIAIPLADPLPIGVSTVNGVLMQDDTFGQQVGAGFIKIPVRVNQPSGLPVVKFETATINLWNTAQP